MQTGAPIWAVTLWPVSALILGHSLETLQRSRASKTHPFWSLWFDSLEVLVGWTTGGTWLAGVTCTVWMLKLCRQIGTLWTPDVILHRLPSVLLLQATRDLVSVLWAHGPAYNVLWHWNLHAHLLCWMGEWPSMWCRLGLWHCQGRTSSPQWGHPSEMNDLSLFPPQFHLCLCGVAAVTQAWACLHVMGAFVSSPLVISLMALSLILDPTTTGTISE